MHINIETSIVLGLDNNKIYVWVAVKYRLNFVVISLAVGFTVMFGGCVVIILRSELRLNKDYLSGLYYATKLPYE